MDLATGENQSMQFDAKSEWFRLERVQTGLVKAVRPAWLNRSPPKRGLDSLVSTSPDVPLQSQLLAMMQTLPPC